MRMIKKYWWVIAIGLIVIFWNKLKTVPMIAQLCEKLGLDNLTNTGVVLPKEETQEKNEEN